VLSGHDPLSRQARADSSVDGKRPCPAAPGDFVERAPPLSLATALPSSVWQEHLRPWLSVREAARLKRVCKALKTEVRGWSMRLGDVEEDHIEAALTCFPSTERIEADFDDRLAPAEQVRLVEVLRRHGGTLKQVRLEEPYEPLRSFQLHSSAVLAGALPNLTSIKLSLDDQKSPQILWGGMLRLLEELEVSLPGERYTAALEPLRHLLHLRRLRLEVTLEAPGVALPNFIPSSLKTLELHMDRDPGALLRGLPSMLQASGASLEEIVLGYMGEWDAECDAALGQVLQACSSTLRTLKLYSIESPQDMLPGLLSCCDTLEVLRCPWHVFSALPATCPTFPRLKVLLLKGWPDKGGVDLGSPAWDIVADGRLPALATLDIREPDKILWEQGEAGGRWACALEAVGGTLRRLTLAAAWGGPDLPAGARYELGVAIGKLRRLRYLHLNIFRDGRDYMAVGRGVAASGAAQSSSSSR
jgi:hypothetical protein